MTHPAPQTWLGGTVLLREGPAKAHLVLIRGRIAQVVPDHRPAPRQGVVTDLAGYLVIPGLVNAHDHLEFNCFPPTAPNRPYTNASAWFADVRSAGDKDTLADVQAIPLKHRLLAGGFKNLLSGATSVAHHNPPNRLLQRQRFPVTVPRGIGYCHSLALDPHPEKTLPGNPSRPWAIHTAEGTDRAARVEVERLSGLGCLRAGSVLVHCLGIDQERDPPLLAAGGASIVWCPGSNEYLYQAVAPIKLLRPQSRVALGTDSMISGGGSMLDELRTARRIDPALGHQTILEMATAARAALFGLAPRKGRVAAGADADLLLFPLPTVGEKDPLSAPFQARLPSLVVRGGIPLVAGAEFLPLLEKMGLKPTALEIDGLERFMPRRLYRRLAGTVTATRGWPPFQGTVSLR